MQCALALLKICRCFRGSPQLFEGELTLEALALPQHHSSALDPRVVNLDLVGPETER